MSIFPARQQGISITFKRQLLKDNFS